MTDRRELHRSLLYRLLASAFLYPDADVGSTICSDEFVQSLRRSADALGEDDVVERIEHLRRAIGSPPDVGHDLAAEYVALFTRNVPCSPYGSRYLVRDVMARPRVLAEVTGYYTAFGVRVDQDHPDLPDHIGMELEFLGYLLAKEVYASDAGWESRAAICRDARGRFLHEHMLLWIPSFRERLHEHARLLFYPAVADVVLAVLENDARSFGRVIGDPVGTGTDGVGSVAHGGNGPLSAFGADLRVADEDSDSDESTFDCVFISR
jgi:putative dimethyl sulfoxide reductase chaperone